jgi:hypothetical protein
MDKPFYAQQFWNKNDENNMVPLWYFLVNDIVRRIDEL